jgi:deoxyribodipyrimidine photo-lyase
MATTVVWFRRDLRVHDHPALAHAAASGDRIAPVFVVDERLLGGRWPAANRLWFMRRAVDELGSTLAELGAPLAVVRGDPERAVCAYAEAVGAARVVASRDHSPYGRARDDRVAARLQAAGIAFDAGRGLLVHEPETIRRADGGPFAMFSPFHRVWQAQTVRDVLPAPERLAGIRPPTGARTTINGLVGPANPTADPALLLEPGETAARARLHRWAGSDALRSYDDGRDRLDRDGTSRLSQDLRWGTLSPVEVITRCGGRGTGPSRFRSEIAWRDFYAHLLAREPRVARESYRRELDDIWTTAADDPVVEAWRDGRTGYPVVDAAMRQLRASGWMHNRARMVTASFLTKHLAVDWRVGERHFMEHLVDGDVASNNGGWQWAASTGTDPQPYIRVFNPVLQGTRHDPTGDYVRRWVPELADEPADRIHVPGARNRYPGPIVDHRAARERALAAYRGASDGSREAR